MLANSKWFALPGAQGEDYQRRLRAAVPGDFLEAGIDYTLTEITDGPTGRDFASRTGTAGRDQTWCGSLRPYGGLVLRIVPKE